MKRSLQAVVGFFSLILISAYSGSSAAEYYDFSDKPTISYEDLVYLIESKGLKSVEETLAELKKQQPQFFENFVLMYRSKSLQKGSFMAPRVLLFDLTGRLVITFNGDPKDVAGYKKLELVQFRDDQNRFEFREISFDGNQGPSFSKANPAKCLACHQSSDRKNIDPRPNWEPYNHWPGAYGSDSGHLRLISKTEIKDIFGEEDRKHILDQAQEKEMLNKFLTDVKPQHSRYKYLGYDDLTYPGSFENKSDRVLARNRRLDDLTHKTVELTEFFGRLNARRVFRIMKEEWAPQWDYLKYAVGGIVQCRKLFLAPDDLQWHLERLPNEFISRVARNVGYKSASYIPSLRRELLSMGVPQEQVDKTIALEEEKIKFPPEYPTYGPSRSIWTLFEPLGISINDWSMDFQTQGRMAFYERFGMPSNFRNALVYASKKVVPEIFEHNCEELERLSTQKIKEYRQTDIFVETIAARVEGIKNKRPLIQRCISCHSGDDPLAPSIPFDDESQLKLELTQGAPGDTLLDDIRYRLGDHATLEDQMPRGLGRPSRQERRQLVRYFESLIE